MAIQRELREQVDICGNFRPPSMIAAVETAYGIEGKAVYAAAAVVTFPELEIVERRFARRPATFSYVPGLFYFREGPAMIAALEQLEEDADVIIVHGHGLAHPERCGIASCIGLAFDTPAIGCARRLLAGRHREVGVERGSEESITLKSQPVGVAYRSRDKVKPIFISPGHLCNIEQARDTVVQCLRGYRLPEPQRIAHASANKSRRLHERDSQMVNF